MQVADSLVRLNFTTPLHVGNERSDYASGNFVMHSDAFMAAIFHAWSRIGYAALIPNDANTSPGFAISSLFPFVKADGDGFIYFLPKPRWRQSQDQHRDEKLDTKLRKKIKKAVYVDWELFQQMLKEGTDSLKLPEPSGLFWSSKQAIQADAIVKSHVVPRAVVSRSGSEDTVIFYMERHYFLPHQSGLYCLIKYEDKGIESKVQEAIRWLGVEGIGTDRNVGNGKFIPEFDWPPDMEISNTGYATNLGLYCPASYDELRQMLDGNNSQVSYEIVRRAGWLSEPYQTWRKRAVYMFREGSVFARSNSSLIKGTMVDVRPLTVQPPISHPIWRCGRTIFIPF